MSITGLLFALQAATAPPERPPVLEFPEAGLDDPAVYRDYGTRFYADAHGNAVQVYLRKDEGRVVLLWANSLNESAGFTARDTAGRPAPLAWGPGGAVTSRSARGHTITYRLELAPAPVTLGWFLLGSMRVERDLQYSRGHLKPFDAPPFRIQELVDLVSRVERLAPAERTRHVAALGARSVEELRRRLDPTVAVRRTATTWLVRVTQPSFDNKHHQTLDLSVPRRSADVTAGRHSVTIRPRGGAAIVVTVAATTDAAPLTPLPAETMFNAEFRTWADRVRAGSDSIAARRLDRQIRGLGLVSYREKLMAGLPNFATYFGRDGMMTALMMEPVWRPEMLEHVIASVLAKVSPEGAVSHEEALGGQAIRENAAEYNRLVAAALTPGASPGPSPGSADTILERARTVLSTLDATRENYLMVDDDFQLPVLVGRYLASAAVSAEDKRRFLEAHLRVLLRNFAYVAERVAPYATDPRATNLVSFGVLPEGGRHPGSWRDSRVGYARGRFAMDVNAIWVPQALRGIAATLAALRDFRIDAARLVHETALVEWMRDPESLQQARSTWAGAIEHFAVALSAAQVRERLGAWLASLPDAERRYWSGRAETSLRPGARMVETPGLRPGSRVVETPGLRPGSGGDTDTLRFLALALDESGEPIPVLNTDVATWLLLEDLPLERVGALIEPVLLPYPVGLLVPGLGPVVANDAYADPPVWEDFRRDAYHSPRVVWGREVNLLLLGIARQIRAAGGNAPSLRDALERIRSAVRASGMEDAELWSYRIEGDSLRPGRYGTSSDVQLWNLTDLAVEFALARVGER